VNPVDSALYTVVSLLLMLAAIVAGTGLVTYMGDLDVKGHLEEGCGADWRNRCGGECHPE
jgi:hypothetical protein